MRMVRKMDAGPLLGQEVVQITREDTGTSLRKKLADSCVPLIQKYLNNLLSSTAFAELPQMENEVTYCRKLKKEDAHFKLFSECEISRMSCPSISEHGQVVYLFTMKLL